MYRADISIEILKYFGIWRPTFFLKGFQSMYNVFSIIVIVVINYCAVSILLYLILVKHNLEDFTESVFYVLAMSAGCVKVATVLFKRNEIIKLRNMLLDKNCHPRDEIEWKIQIKCDQVGRKFTIIFLVTVSVSTIINAITPLMKSSNTTFPFKTWTPPNLKNRIIFWIMYFVQAVGVTTVTQIIIAVDTLGMVMIMQLSAQLEILLHRIQQYSQFCMNRNICQIPYKQQMILRTWIEHHDSMFRYGKNLNNIYNWVLFSQLCSTTIDVCTSTYLLSSVSITTSIFWRMVFGLFAIMLQICLYCLPGNVVMEKSKEIGYAVYNMDWILLPSRSRMNSINIMKRAEIPIEFTAGKIFPMTLETFMSILKLSFSIYNFLIHSSL